MGVWLAYTKEEGEELVKAARSTIELHIRSPLFDKNIIERMLKDHNKHDTVVVRILHHPTMTVLGASDPNIRFPGGMAIIEAALSAARKNRSIPLTERELDEISVEVNSLGPPDRLPPEFVDRMKEVDEKKHGVMVVYGTHIGLVLPTDADEKKLGKIAYLETACERAGLPRDYWKQSHINIYKMNVQRFWEERPAGKVRG